MRLSEIVIPEEFQQSKPREAKMQKCRDLMEKYRHQDRFLVVNRNNVLIDGYIQYLVLKEKGIKTAEVKRLDCKVPNFARMDEIPKYKREITTYVYGVFKRKDGTFSKQYVWRVPKSLSDRGWDRDLLPGDKVFVSVNGKEKYVTVTKIHRTDKCPVVMPVKKVMPKRWKN